MRLRHLLKTTLLTTLFLIGWSVGWGQLIITEDFNYPDNALLTANGWTAHSGGGTQPIDVGASNGLIYDGYSGLTGMTGVIPGNAARIDNTGEDDSKTFTAITSGTIYYSALIKVSNATAGYFMHLGASGTSFTTRIWVQPSVNAGKFNFGFSNGSTAAYSTTDFDLNTTYLVIVKYNVSTSGDASIWVKDSGIPTTEVLAGAPLMTTTGSGQTSIDRICLRQFNASQNQTVDGIRLGLSWEDIFDFTPPVWTASYPSFSNIEQSKADLIVNLNEKGKAFYVVLPNEAVAPTSAQVIAGHDASDEAVALSGSIDLASKTTNYTAHISGLTHTTDYDVYVVAEDVVGTPNLQASPVLVELKTLEPDVTPPVWTAEYPKVSAIANTDFNILVSLNEVGYAYYVIQNAGETAPTATQVKNGLAFNDAPAIKSGSIDITSVSTEFSANINALLPGTLYNLYVVAIDKAAEPNLQTSVTSIDVTTTDTKPEPTNQPTEFAVEATSQTSVTLSWTDAIGEQLPAGYLILFNETGEFTDPVDGTAQANSASVANVAYGVQTLNLSDLSGSHYYFKIYSYTNSGTATDYLLTAPLSTETILKKLTFTNPVGGETYYAGDDVTLTWTSENITEVNIEVSSNDGETWESLLGPITSDGTEDITVPADASYSNTYKLRIQDAANSSINNVTAKFTVKAVTSNLSDLLTMPNNAVVKYTGKATVTYARTARNQKYIQDETGAVLIDDATTAPGFIHDTYNIGDGITNIEGKIVNYNGLIELNPTSVTGEPCTGNPEIVPEVRTIESLTHMDQCKLVKIENFTFATTGVYETSSVFAGSKNYDITGYANTVFAYRTLFAEADYIGTEIPLYPITATVIVGQFNDAIQITARNFADITSTAAYVTSDVYTITFENMTISDIPETHNLATFKSNLVVSPNGTYDVYDADGVTPATVLDNTKKVIVVAQDGVTTATYSISISYHTPSTNANLSKISVNGTAINGFLSSVTSYAVLLPVGTSELPEITYVQAEPNSTVEVTNASNLFGTEAERTAKVVVTAENGTTVKTYSIVFTVDNTGVGPNAAIKLSIYPVPAVNELNVTGLAFNSRVEIMDITGKIIGNYISVNDKLTIDVSELRKGMYFLRSDNQTLKFIKK